jgi:4'-phosphopantetheinyl transferase
MDGAIVDRFALDGALALLTAAPLDGRGLDDLRLGALLSVATGRRDIQVVRRPSGRPALAPPYHELGVSIARRAGHTLVGFAPDRPIGVDLEPDDGIPEAEIIDLARQNFSAGEAAALGALKPSSSRALFIKLWVAKEAVLKLTGRGIYDGLDEPDLATVIDRLQHGPWPMAIAAGQRVPRARLRLHSLASGAVQFTCGIAILD